MENPKTLADAARMLGDMVTQHQDSLLLEVARTLPAWQPGCGRGGALPPSTLTPLQADEARKRVSLTLFDMSSVTTGGWYVTLDDQRVTAVFGCREYRTLGDELKFGIQDVTQEMSVRLPERHRVMDRRGVVAAERESFAAKLYPLADQFSRDMKTIQAEIKAAMPQGVKPMGDRFKVGDKVWLRSGGPALIVEGIAPDGRVDVCWYDDSQALQHARLPPDTLMRERPL